MKRILLCLSHCVEESLQLDLLTDLGYEVASFGAYIDPANPTEDRRPPLPHIPLIPEVYMAYEDAKADGIEPQERIPLTVLDWLGDDGIIIYHHLLWRLWGQWSRVRDWMKGTHGRVIWRSVGQSVRNNEVEAQPYMIGGLERVAYSPKEANLPDYAGHDAVIRFWSPSVTRPWTGEDDVILNVTQELRARDPYTNWGFWDSATRGLPRRPMGPGSEMIEGTGGLSFGEIEDRLLAGRAYLYTGTQPASYTLGLLEALHAGIPVVSIGPSWMRIDYDGHTAADLFEGHELAPLWSDDPNEARHMLRRLLDDEDHARTISDECRGIARRLFDRETIGREWKSYLG